MKRYALDVTWGAVIVAMACVVGAAVGSLAVVPAWVVWGTVNATTGMDDDGEFRGIAWTCGTIAVLVALGVVGAAFRQGRPAKTSGVTTP
jgi:hypothetical protein